MTEPRRFCTRTRSRQVICPRSEVASFGLTDFSQVDMLALRYKSDNFGAETKKLVRSNRPARQVLRSIADVVFDVWPVRKRPVLPTGYVPLEVKDRVLC